MRVAAPLLATCALLLSPGLDAQTKKVAAPPPGNCHDSCVVTVNLAAGCGSGIRVSLDPITVTRGNTTTITWNFVPADPNGWKFDRATGIVIQGLDTYAYAKERFPKGRPQATSDHSFQVVHTNNGPGAFKYDVNLVKGIAPNQQTCSLDPTIIDQ